MTERRPRVVVATPLSPELCDLIVRAEPRIDLVCDQTLLPPMRHPADFEGDPGFTRSPTEQRAFDDLVDSADVLYGIPDVKPGALHRTVNANPKLRWVHVMAAGGGGQVRAAGLTPTQLDRIVFTTSNGVHGAPLAEFAVFGVLAGAKRLDRLRRDQVAHRWPERWMMRQVSEQTVLVLGLGGIGAHVVAKLTALGATVIGVSRHPIDLPGVDRIVSPDDLADVVGDVDAIVTSLPGTDSTARLIGAEVLERVKPGVTIVNVGRGTVVDEPALISALRDGRVGFAALDVVAEEPLSPESALWDAPNVLLSPHTAALSDTEDRLIAELFAANATRYIDGAPLLNRVNTVEFY
ncbi:D-2-hydroxyacid dehydrogenase [Galbitalea sp. SE-J8]|uniref:D-2-hydroxyacid dehydrogenase n=1 Tax=Galbitalea sp. SE-J8 TaxID=3054952 RepID=UPI00259C9B66|nr:D-2-hydroxyacid dehydrogenase [Galbitalea sp. SE-J8]MDM4763013.1 D-2-hydroxyacid dehydrogenase [Galbitalea sp. SE-J8]